MGKISRWSNTCEGLREQALRSDLPFEGEYDLRVRDCIEIFLRL